MEFVIELQWRTLSRRGAERIYTYAEGSLSYAYSANPISLAGMQLSYSLEKLTSNRAMHWKREKREGRRGFGSSILEEAGWIRAWRLWITYFDLSPCFGIFSSTVFLFLWLPVFFIPCMFCEWEWKREMWVTTQIRKLSPVEWRVLFLLLKGWKNGNTIITDYLRKYSRNNHRCISTPRASGLHYLYIYSYFPTIWVFIYLVLLVILGMHSR